MIARCQSWTGTWYQTTRSAVAVSSHSAAVAIPGCQSQRVTYEEGGVSAASPSVLDREQPRMARRAARIAPGNASNARQASSRATAIFRAS